MQLSEHFTLEELTRSDRAVLAKIDNSAAPGIIENLRKVAEVLERIRLVFGGPVVVSSGYRCPELNALVGGSKTSAHMRGLAADISIPGKSPREVAQTLTSWVYPLDLDQLIYEGTWVHVGLADTPRHQILTAKFSSAGVSYMKGIV